MGIDDRDAKTRADSLIPASDRWRSSSDVADCRPRQEGRADMGVLDRLLPHFLDRDSRAPAPPRCHLDAPVLSQDWVVCQQSRWGHRRRCGRHTHDPARNTRPARYTFEEKDRIMAGSGSEKRQKRDQACSFCLRSLGLGSPGARSGCVGAGEPKPQDLE